MTLIKKYAWYGAAVTASLVLAAALVLGSVSTAEAASIATAPTITIPIAANTGTGSNQAASVGDIKVTEASAAEWASAETEVLNGPAGFTLSGTVTASGTSGWAGSCVVAATSVTCTASASSTSASTITISGLKIVPDTAATVSGTMTFGGASTGPLTAGTAATINIDNVSGSVSVTVSPTSIKADGSQAATVTALVFDGVTPVAVATSVTFTSSIGAFGSSTTSSTYTSGSGTGVATRSYNGTGSTGTDTIVVSVPSLSAVGTVQITLTGATGTLPSALAFSSVDNGYVAANNSGATYTSPTASTALYFRVTDSAGNGVNGELMQVSTDKGALSETSTCGTSKVITPTSANKGGSASRPGYVEVHYCPSSSQTGTATITAVDITTSSIAAATTTVVAAGKPSQVTAVVAGNVVTATAMDAGGNLVADGTVVTFSIPSTQGVVSVGCATTTKGVANTAAALVGSSGSVLISVQAGSPAPTCAAQGAVVASAVATVGLPSTTPPPSTGGAGTFDRAISNVGVNTAVWNGGTIAQLDAATAAAGGISVTTYVGGKPKVEIPGAPAFVNAEFAAAFSDGTVPAGTIVLVVK